MEMCWRYHGDALVVQPPPKVGLRSLQPASTAWPRAAPRRGALRAQPGPACAPVAARDVAAPPVDFASGSPPPPPLPRHAASPRRSPAALRAVR